MKFTIRLQTRAEQALLDAAMERARAKAKPVKLEMVRRFPHLSRTCAEARFASWNRVDMEVSRLLFNIKTCGAQKGDRRKLARLSAAAAKALAELDAAPVS